MKQMVKFEVVDSEGKTVGTEFFDVNTVIGVLDHSGSVDDDGDEAICPGGCTVIERENVFMRVRGNIDETMAKLEKAWSAK